MSIIFVRRDNQILLATPSTPDILDHVPAAVYTPYINVEDKEVGLTRIADKFEQASQERFGDIVRHKQTILNTYNSRDGLTGVMAVGDPGSGKTLLAEDVANSLIAQGLPVIYVNSAFPLSVLHDIVRHVRPCMVFVDEFGKNYPGSKETGDGEVSVNRADLLTFIGDASLKKVLFFTASNREDKAQVSGINNRPSRMMLRVDSNRMEVSSYLELIEQSKASPALRETLLMNVLEGDLLQKSDYWSTDALRVVLSIVDENTTLNTLRRDCEILNVPPFHNNTFKITCTSAVPVEFDSGKFNVIRNGDSVTLQWSNDEGVIYEDTVVFNFFNFVRDRLRGFNDLSNESVDVSAAEISFSLNGTIFRAKVTNVHKSADSNASVRGDDTATSGFLSPEKRKEMEESFSGGFLKTYLMGTTSRDESVQSN